MVTLKMLLALMNRKMMVMMMTTTTDQMKAGQGQEDVTGAVDDRM